MKFSVKLKKNNALSRGSVSFRFIKVLLRCCAALLVGFLHLLLMLTNCNIVALTCNIKTMVVFQIVY